MAPREYDFRPPEPPRREALAPEPQRELRPRPTPWGLIATAVLASLAALSLIVAASVIWGPTSQPQALGDGATTGAHASDTNAPDASDQPVTTPEAVTPGQLVPITMNAQFSQGVTLVPPPVGEWAEINIINRPEQFTAQSPDYTSQIEVWQTTINTTPVSDEYLSQAQLNRIGDECGNPPSVMGGDAEIYTLTGKDGTKLELLLKKALNCDGGELWLFERLMPHSDTRFHIVLWSTRDIASNADLQAMLAQVTFTVP